MANICEVCRKMYEITNPAEKKLELIKEELARQAKTIEGWKSSKEKLLPGDTDFQTGFEDCHNRLVNLVR